MSPSIRGRGEMADKCRECGGIVEHISCINCGKTSIGCERCCYVEPCDCSEGEDHD